MIQRVQFPEYLDSYKGLNPSQFEQLKFQNYFPRSQRLKQNSKIIPINDDCQIIQRQLIQQMNSLTLDTLYEDGKINILPKKTTLDLKRALAKKMGKIQKKTQKAIQIIAKQLLINKKKQLKNQ